MIDSKLLIPGIAGYNGLNDVYIIMIMPFDLFGEGRYRYTFRMSCEEVPGLDLRDGVTRIFLNTRGSNAEGESEELIGLLRYFEDSSADSAMRSGSDRVMKLHEKVEKLRKSEEMGVRFMNAWEEKLLDRQDGYEEGLEEGLAAGEKRGRKSGLAEGKKHERSQIAFKMKEKGISYSDIAEITGMSESEIEKL